MNKKNEYFKFIKSCKGKKTDKNLKYQNHHIIPKYMFRNKENPLELIFQESPLNYISLSVADHIQAHLLLLAIYGNWQDRGAVSYLTADVGVAMRLGKQKGAAAVHSLQSNNKTNFWDPAYQKEHHEAMHMDKVFKADDRYLWFYKNEAKVCTFNCRLTGEVGAILYSIIPKKLSDISGLLNGRRKSHQGWTVEKLSNTAI